MSTPATTIADGLKTLKDAYPGHYWAADEWPSVVETFTRALKSYPPHIILETFARAITEHPDRFPKLGQLTAIAMPMYRDWQSDQWEKNKHRALPPKPSSTGEAIAAFDAHCERALKMNLGPTINLDNRHLVEGCVAALGPVFGIDATAMREDRHGFDHAKCLVSIWRNRGYAPAQVIAGLRRVPKHYGGKFPTAGMLHELITVGKPTSYTPDEYQKQTQPRSNP